MLLNLRICAVEQRHHVGPVRKEVQGSLERDSDGESHIAPASMRAAFAPSESCCDAVLEHRALTIGQQLDEGRQDASFIRTKFGICQGIKSGQGVFAAQS
jgi:hypothetical protein